MDKAEVVANPHGEVVVCPVNEKMAESRIKILSSAVIDKVKSLEEEDVLVVAGRGVRNEKDVEMCRELAEALGGQRPLPVRWWKTDLAIRRIRSVCPAVPCGRN